MEKIAKWEEMLRCLHTDVIPATGCTEPIAVAYAAAIAAHLCQGERMTQIQVRVSPNIMKNAMGVIVPGTGTPGLTIAAAVGALGGDPEGGLQVLRHITPAIVKEAQQLIAQEKVSVTIAPESPHILYAEVVIDTEYHQSCVRIAQSHTHVIYKSVDGTVLFEEPVKETAGLSAKVRFLQSLTLQDIYDFATQVPLAEITFIKDAAQMNEALSLEGLHKEYGLGLGKAMQQAIEDGLLAEGLMNAIVMKTTAASDARMGGAPLPAMTNSGSGNQGITATAPVVVMAQMRGATEEELLRALVLSHMVAIYVHAFLPKLSALCAVSTAGMGSAAGMAWLLQKKYDCVARALCSMAGDVIGMICDGAASSCAAKVATSTTSAIRAVLLAVQGKRVPGSDGIVAEDVDATIRNIGRLATEGMKDTDANILDIMLHKNQ